MAERVERRLAAIFAADAVGYSRLMDADEEATLAALNSHLTEFIEPTIAGHQGRIVKLMGDGVLAEFPSAVDAVRCALTIQRGMPERSKNLPEEKWIIFRIGINVGDTMIQGDDIYGGGVNVASRLEALADAGGILASGTAYDQVAGKLDCGFEFIGEQTVKNIEQPIRAYRVILDGTGGAGTARWHFRTTKAKMLFAAACTVLILGVGTIGWLQTRNSSDQSADSEAAPLQLPSKPSIAVLPFANLSNDSDQDYLVDGIANDVITNLSKFTDLFVIAANSTFQYKAQSVQTTKVAEELGVRYVLQGTVRETGDNLRINAQLIDATTGAHVWAQDYDRKIDDLFETQQEITQSIVGTIGTVQSGALQQAEMERISRKPTDSLSAYDRYLRAIHLTQLETKGDNEKARQLLQQAIALDPDFAQAYAALGDLYVRDVSGDWTDTREADLAKAKELAERAIEIDQTEPFGYHALAAYYSHQAQNDQAIAQLRKAESLNSNDFHTQQFLGYLLAYSGSPEEGLIHLEAAMRLNPLHGEEVLRSTAQALFFAGRYEDSIATLNKITRRHRTSIWLYLAASYAQLGQLDKARNAIDEALKLKSSLTLESEIDRRIRNGLSTENADYLRDALRKAGNLPSGVPDS